MPSRKKDRGKQRKAAKQNSNGLAGRAAAPTPIGAQERDCADDLMKALGCRISREDGRISNPCLNHIKGDNDVDAKMNGLMNFDRGLLSDEERQELAENYVHNYAQDLREGDFNGTDIIMRNMADSRIRPQLGIELTKAGIHLSMLHFLGQSHRPVSDILGRVVAVGESTKLSFYWVGILGMIMQNGFSVDAPEDAWLTVAKGMGPFVASLVDGKRELFRSNHVWHLCLAPFFIISQSVILSREAFLVMISYEGFLPFVAQASCWSQSREDIVEECRMLRQDHPLSESSISCPEPSSKVGHEAQRVIASILLGYDDDKSAEMRRALDQVACAPLCGNDPNCTDSTMVGFVRMLNEKSDVIDREVLFDCIIKPLLMEHGYVDARVIAELIEFGNQSMAATATVIRTMASILGRNEAYDRITGVDSRYAAAVRLGLLEFCVDALVAYGDESDCNLSGLIAEGTQAIAYGLCSMAMHSKTSRALCERNVDIMTALGALRPQSGSQFEETASIINDAVEAASCATCCNCLRECDRKDLLFCKRCGVECYCSLACQSESYALGHDKVCKEVVQDSDGLREDGLSETELKRWKVLSSNLMMNGCRLVQSRAVEFLDQERNVAEVTVNFVQCPPKINVSTSDEGGSSRRLKCTFIVPVFYGFAHRVNVDAYFLEKVISKRSLAEPGSSD